MYFCVFQQDRFVFNVVADDNGERLVQRSVVQVIVNVHEMQHSAPQWQTSEECMATVSVDEDIPVCATFLSRSVIWKLLKNSIYLLDIISFHTFSSDFGIF